MKNQLKIGWGKRSIAPDAPTPIPGQFNMRVSMGCYNPVLANALVLEKDGESVIFVSCDAVSISPEILKKSQHILAEEIPGFPAEKIIPNIPTVLTFCPRKKFGLFSAVRLRML